MLKKLFFIISLFISHLFALETISPVKSFETTGTVQSMVYVKNKLYAGTNNGTVEIFDIEKNQKIKSIKIPSIKDFMGDEIAAKIYSIDVIDDKILIVSQGMRGYRNIFIVENDSLVKVIDIDQKMFIQKASFVSADLIVFGLLSNQLGLYNIKTKKQLYLKQISHSSFSHFMLSEDKKTVAHTDESGKVRILDVTTADELEKSRAVNLDKVYQLDFKKGVILTAGQDRKSVVYSGSNSYSLDFDFLLYACALSLDAKRGAIAYNEQNEILIFDIKNQKYLYNLSAQEATLTQILFINEKELFVSSDSQIINYYKLQ